MSIKKGGFGELAWLLGVVLCALGICFATKSNLGVSMVVAPAFVIYNKVVTVLPWFTLGMSEYCLQGVLLILLAVCLGKFKWKYLLSFGTAMFYGVCVDFWRMIFGKWVYTVFWQQVVSAAVGIIITAIAISFSLRTYLPQQAYELIVSEISNEFGFKMNKVKWIYDVSSLLAAIVLMLILFGRFDLSMVGVITLIITVVNTPLIAIFGSLWERKMTFDAKFVRFKELFDRWMD